MTDYLLIQAVNGLVIGVIYASEEATCRCVTWILLTVPRGSLHTPPC